MKKRWLTILGILFVFILGFILVLSPSFNSYKITNAGSSMIKTNNDEREKVLYSFEEDNEVAEEQEIPFPSPPNVSLGEIIIPKVDIHLPILNGSTKENLDVGATTLSRNQQMGVSNYALAGHNMYDRSLLFSRVDELVEGDQVKITDFETVYTYEVTSMEIVNETETSVLNHTEESELTLITCDSAGSVLRLIVKGELINEVDFKEEDWG